MKRIKTAVQKFGQQSAFYSALKDFFETLNLKINYLNDKPIDPGHLLKRTYKSGNPTHALMEDVYCLGMIDNASIKNEKDKSLEEIKKDEKDYDGVLIFGVTLKKRDNGNLPSRSQLAELTRSFNREFYYTPVVVVFRYSEFISIANIERTSYKQTWREGEKTGKVSILREININKPHTGHIKIIKELDIQGKKVEITIEGRKKKVPITTFDLFYQYWQSVFNVALLNKQFYKELSDWYFWAIDEVVFPGGPALKHFGTKTPELREHNAQNLIRLLTRILFVWFIKEKGLIPEEVFDENYIKTHLLKEFREKKEHGNYEDRNSRYYRAILQNLFFATLNQEQGKREFRKNKQHMNITNLMRYKRYFKDPKLFIDLVEKTVPFMNGGLFECLDHPIPGQKGPKGGDVIEYIDGFSDRSDNVLTVPDNIFFGTQSHVNLSEAYGEGKNKNKDVTVKGLINLLDSYKFTIDENTPVEQDIALDPELLGRVFENLLASYNPETKTTARKQTGSFYTPREIVDYMVDESLIAYLKNDLNAFYTEEPLLDERLHQLFSYDDIQPFEEEKEINQIISSIDQCKILDPACGSGAFPMGALQKMVHVIHKIDPKNKKWKERQIKKLDYLEDSELRGTLVDNIEEAFSNNELDYGRKLFLIENCIYGVDIQPIAIQISKLRFFISLIVDQKIDKQKPNFGVRPLPNLETKFVAANSLIGLDSTKRLKTQNVINLEKELSDIRHRLFSAKTPKTKRNLREEDKRIREELENELIDSGWKNETAKQIACWDPYDQNQSSDFFDPEWMFDVGNGFDIVIGNPPYIKETTNKSVFRKLKNKKYYQGKMDIWYYFASVCIDIIKQGKGILTFIATNNWVTNSGATKLRKKIISETRLIKFIDFSNFRVFESAGIQTMILMLKKQKAENYLVDFSKLKVSDIAFSELKKFLDSVEDERFEFYKSEFHFIDKRSNSICFLSKNTDHLINQIRSKKNFDLLDQEINSGIDITQDFLKRNHLKILGEGYKIGQGVFVLNDNELKVLNLLDSEKRIIKPFFTTSELYRYKVIKRNKYWIIYTTSKFKNSKEIKNYPNIKKHLDQFQDIITSENKPYGLNRARNEKFFKNKKIIVQRKCTDKQSFVYVDFDSYVNRTFIPIKTERISLKYLVGLFNSVVVTFWLRNTGKIQGHNLQVDKDPILSIPIYKDPRRQKAVEFLVTVNLYVSNSTLFEKVLDTCFLNIYFPEHMKSNNIDVNDYIEQDIQKVMQGKNFEDLSDTDKRTVIDQLQKEWTDPNNEVVKRMAQFKTKSPDILKPILES